jgi:hypothetical protein
MDDSLSGTSNVGTIKVVSTSTYTGSSILTDDYKIEIIGNLDLDRIASGSWHGDVIASDKVTHRTVTAGGNTVAQSETLAFTAGTNVTISEAGGAVTINAAGTAATNLSKTVSGDGFSVNSSTGDNVALSLADTSNWGLMSDEMFDKLDGIEASANNYSHPNHSGDVTSSGDGATTIANDKVTYAKMQNIPTANILGRVTAGTGNVEDLTATQVRTLLNVADGATNVTNNNQITNGAGYTTAAGTVDTSGTPAAQQIAIFTDANTISGSTNLQMHVNGSYPEFGGLQVGSGGTANLYLGNPITPSSADKGARFHSNNNDFYFDFQGDATQNFYFRDYDGSGGIHNRFTFDFINSGFTAATATFSANVTANNFVTTSDRELKDNIVPIKEGLETLKKFVSYEYELEGKKDAGFIAHQV